MRQNLTRGYTEAPCARWAGEGRFFPSPVTLKPLPERGAFPWALREEPCNDRGRRSGTPKRAQDECRAHELFSEDDQWSSVFGTSRVVGQVN